MYIALIVVHIIACCFLIAAILLQAGRGGGLTEMFGGGGETAQSVLGTQAPAILKKATTVSAIVFLLTSLILGMVAARRGRSLFERMQLPAAPVAPGQGVSPAAQPAALPSEEAQPAAKPVS